MKSKISKNSTSKKNPVILSARIVIDVLLVMLAWFLAYYLRFETHLLAAPKGVPPLILYIKMLPFIAGIWLFISTLNGFYPRTGRHRSAFTEALDIIQTCLMVTLSFIVFTYFYEEYRYSRITLLFFLIVAPVLVITGRSLIRKSIRRYRRSSPVRKTLILGSGEPLQQAFEMHEHFDLAPSKVEAVILIGDAENMTAGQEYCSRMGLPVVPAPKDWTTFLVENNIQSVICALPHSSFQFLEDNLALIADQVTDIKLVPDLRRFIRFAPGIELVAGLPIITIHDSPLSGSGAMIKRLLDIFGAIAGIVIFSPIMLFATCFIPLSSRGPIFYRQERMGLDGRTFPMIKFRTMPVDAEKQTGPVWATESDSRPTNFGKFLRKYSFDETPQFFQVLFGQMSLVGPRPERPVFVEQFRRSVPGYMLRHKAKSGLTGWAQINGWRGNTSVEKRIQYDLYYIQNWSVWLDLKIIGATVLKVFFDRNAY